MKKISRSNFQTGQGVTEYALLLVLIVGGLILIVNLTGTSITDLYCQAANGISGGRACGQEIYCQDDFTGDGSGWQNLSGLPSFQNGQMCVSGYMQIMNKCSTQKKHSDYTINLNGVTLTQGNGYGIYFRSILTERGLDGYAFQYDPGAGNILLIRRWINGREVMTPIGKFPITTSIYNTPHDFKIVVKDETFTVFMDGEQVITAEDKTYPTGGVGLRSWDSTTACIDDFSITRNP